MWKTLKNGKREFDYIKMIPFLICLSVLMITIGYSSLTANLAIDISSVVVRVDPNIKVTGITNSTMSNGGVSNSTDHGNDYIDANIELPNANSKVSYDITISNIGNVEMMLANITGLPTGLTYTFTGYTLTDVLCDDVNNTQCKLGSTTTIHIVIGYTNNTAYNNAASRTFDFTLNLDFEEVVWKAQIGSTKYALVQKAMDAVPANGTETVVTLLDDATERITILAGKNVTIDMGNNTLYGSPANYATGNPVFEIYGTLRMNNGTISTNVSQGAVNVFTGGTFIMTGGQIIATGTRQAVYIDGGTATIGGSAYLSNVSGERAAVQNQSDGVLTITGGTIVAQKFYGVSNIAGTLTIGVKDGTVSTTVPSIQGGNYGVYNFNGTAATNFSYYDGVIRGKTAAIYDDSHVIDKETGYGIAYQTETSGGVTFQKATCQLLSNVVQVTFDYNDTTGETYSKNVAIGTSVGSFPARTRTDYVLDGWWTDPVNGTEVDANTVVNAPVTYYAHWVHVNDYRVARIGTTEYATLSAAVAAVTTNAATTIELIRNTSDNITIAKGRNITLDFHDKRLLGVGDAAVIVNKGNCTFVGGTIETNSQSTSAINNESGGVFTMTGGSIIANGKRQALYNNGGTSTISGSSYLSAATNERATVHNLANGTVTITGGTVVGVNFAAVNNVAGTINVGTSGGGIDATTPVFMGATYGLMNSSKFNFYDGKIMGVTGAISGSITIQEAGSTIVTTTEVVDGVTYNVKYLN